MTAAAVLRRIMVMGLSGSGESTLARRLGVALGLPVVHLDQLYHGRGFQPRPDGAFLPAVEAAARRPAWVIDGDYARAIATRLARADLIVLLDLRRRVTLPRLVRRIATGWAGFAPAALRAVPSGSMPNF